MNATGEDEGRLKVLEALSRGAIRHGQRAYRKAVGLAPPGDN